MRGRNKIVIDPLGHCQVRVACSACIQLHVACWCEKMWRVSHHLLNVRGYVRLYVGVLVRKRMYRKGFCLVVGIV